jgi:TM2 domain-containing membrane protein YozV
MTQSNMTPTGPGGPVGPAGTPGGMPSDIANRKLVAGILGILLGGLGIHKFYLGMNTPGIIMLVVTLVTCGFGGFITGIIGIVEGIMYLTKSDQDFYQQYIVEKKQWF